MGLGDFLKEFWWLFFWLIPLLILYIYQKNKDSVLGLSYSDQSLLLEFGLILLFIFLIQKYIFGEHLFFIIAIPILFILYFMLIGYLLRGNDYYLCEATILNEIHYDIEGKEKHISPNSHARLLRMDKSVYEDIRHIGEADYPFWNGNEKFKFCDLFLDDKKIAFHPQLPQMHNITIYMARAFMLKMKEDIPELYYDNIMLTWLSPYKTLFQLYQMKENFPLHLSSIKKQYDYKPFTMPKSTKDIFDDMFLEAMKTAKAEEQLQKTLKETESDVSNLLKEGESK